MGRYSNEQKAKILASIEARRAEGLSTHAASEEAGITVKTYRTWRESTGSKVIVHENKIPVRKYKRRQEASQPVSACIIMLVKITDLKAVIGGLQ